MPVSVSFDFPRSIRRGRPRRLISISDGDTPKIEQPVRLVSADTPEKAGYAGRAELSQPKLDRCRERLEDGSYDSLPAGLRAYLVQRLGSEAAADHVAAGDRATEEFQRILDERLERESGTPRSLATIPTGELIDRYGRLLAYLAPWYARTEADPLPPRDDPSRRTFNFQMVEEGWAAFFPIYPSLPRNNDLNRTIAAAERAWDEQRGAWNEFGPDLLLAYEFRLCVKIGTAASADEGIERAFQRVCFDLRDMSDKGLFGFYEVPPPYRLWAWNDDTLPRTRLELGVA